MLLTVLIYTEFRKKRYYFINLVYTVLYEVVALFFINVGKGHCIVSVCL